MTRLEIIGQTGFSKDIRAVTIAHTTATVIYIIHTVSAFSDDLYIE